MQFICKRCGTKKEIQIFSRDIFRCWCDECGASIPNGKAYGLLQMSKYPIVLIVFLYIIKSEVDISFFWLVVGCGVLWILIWFVAILLGGRENWYGDDADELKEEEMKHPVLCQECGRIIDIPTSLFFDSGQVRCPECHKKFSFHDVDEMGCIPLFIDIVGSIITAAFGCWVIAIEETLLPIFLANHMLVSRCFRLVLLFFTFVAVKLIGVRILLFLYHKKVIQKK